MKKVMFVDDEILIREHIRDYVDWDKEGFIYCGDASDGEMALPLIEKWRPDILITDIKMPFMDGIQLSKIVRQRLPNTKIVILSGHDEFDYARTALRIGVEEYLLKPLGSNDLIKLLQNVSRKIDQERQANKNVPFVKEKLMSDLCGGLISISDAAEAANALSLSLFVRYYAVIVWDVRYLEPTANLDSSIIYQTDDIMESAKTTYNSCWSFKRSKSEYVWILYSENETQLQSNIEHIRTNTYTQLNALLSPTVMLGIGTVQDRLQGIHTSFLEAEEDRNLKRYSQSNKHALWNAANGATNQMILLDRASFHNFLKVGRSADLQSFLKTFTSTVLTLEWQSSLYGYYLINDLTLETLQWSKETFRSAAAEVTEMLITSMQQKIRAIEDMSQCEEYLIILIEQIWKWRSESTDRYGDLIYKVKMFIEQNYANDMVSLQDAAEHVSISPSHLSKIFSQESGSTFIEYLTLTRIMKAKELLHTTSDKSYEISFKVGYNDPHYFSNLFKKMTGMTPRDFRRQSSTTTSLKSGEFHD
ncbi:MAG: response regulator [Candidatus Pristimantibacillus lignocellulolyticus]|uniref:Response regulator n=1 Tax=Candidatus Pristimantibacillus lignocellulolyticus TaxID=2994561 RepID=A0A9J6ZF49_9BACL|nr:MAG: response regulator [Candidatus Pristimantibacillus lignocellulolyticus]